MRVHIVTIVLDGMPWLGMQLATMNRLQGLDWVWHISHGVAKNIGCTQWCKQIAPRLSSDSTTEFLNALKKHPRIKVYEKPEWEGKLEMVNAGMSQVEQGDVVIEVDVDEIWTARQIELIARMLDNNSKADAMRFRCRYFVGPNLILKGYDHYGNHTDYEWHRAWRATNPVFMFTRHEPPQVAQPERPIMHAETESIGLVFDHYAYATQQQVAFKERYYGYEGAVAQWKELQACEKFPVKLKKYLKWVTDEAEVVPL